MTFTLTKRNAWMGIAIVCALGCTAATLVYAKRKHTPQTPYKGAYYYTPRATRIKFKVQKTVIKQAGYPTPYTVIHTPHFDMRMPEPEQWVLTQDPASGLAFKHKSFEGAQFSFTLYTNRRTFLPSVDETSLQGYVEGLKRKHWGSLEVFNEGRYAGRGPHSFKNIIGHNFLYVHYKIKDRRDRRKYWIHLDYFLETSKEIMAVRFICPEEKSKQAIEDFDYYINRLILLRNQEKFKKMRKRNAKISKS